MDIFQGETLNKRIHLFTRNSSGPCALNYFRIPLAVLTDQAAYEIGNSLEIARVFITRRVRLRSRLFT